MLQHVNRIRKQRGNGYVFELEHEGPDARADHTHSHTMHSTSRTDHARGDKRHERAAD